MKCILMDTKHIIKLDKYNINIGIYYVHKSTFLLMIALIIYFN